MDFASMESSGTNFPQILRDDCSGYCLPLLLKSFSLWVISLWLCFAFPKWLMMLRAFLCLLIIHVSSLQKCLLKSLAHCFNFLLSCKSSLHLLVVVYSLSHVQLFYDPMDCSPSDSSMQGIPQVRILEQVVISFSKGSSWLKDRTQVSCIGRWILYH